MDTSKNGVRLIVEICRQRGIRKVVFSPGSRSAPLVIAFSRIREIECIVIPDERVAGYFALGMAQQSGKMVALVCTSGTAVLNLSPAVCEAHYQNIPLLVLTADRPKDAVKRGENQAINQENIFGHFSRSLTVNGDLKDKKDLSAMASRVTAVIDACQYPDTGPAHINIQLAEPLYQTIDETQMRIAIPRAKKPDSNRMRSSDAHKIKTAFERFERKMIIVGMHDRDTEFLNALKKLNQRNDLVIIRESLSGMKREAAVWNAESCIASFDNTSSLKFVPDLVITLGNQIISKKLVQFLNGKPKIHWDIPISSAAGRNRNLFGKMTRPIRPVNEKQFLKILLDLLDKMPSNYKKDWLALSKRSEKKSLEYLSGTKFSDLKVFDILIKSFPPKANIQYGNSTPVRYSNLFSHGDSLRINANRGVSGIDGCVSTAAGGAFVNKGMTVSVVGDISFLYDSNALWNNYLSPDFRIIIINNSGGNIFRWIDGAAGLKDFEKFFETAHNLTAEHLASMYDIPYYICAAQNELEAILKTFYEPYDKPKILEIKTNGKLSAAIYKGYFEFLKNKE